MKQHYKPLPDAQVVRARLIYCPKAGTFTWLTKPITKQQDIAWNAVYAGTSCGNIQPQNGYLWIRMDNVDYTAQRLAWKYMTGEDPPEQIDHADTDRLNNRWSNLRLATNGQNSQNKTKRSDSTSGHKNIIWNPLNKNWSVEIMANGIRHRRFAIPTLDEAIIIRDELLDKLHGEFSRV